MTTDLTLVGQAPALAAGRRSTVAQAARQGIAVGGFATVGYKGKVWSTKFKQEEEILRDERKRPLQDLEVIVIAASKYVSKSFYLEGFQEGVTGKAPDCFSVNGIEPDPGSTKKQSKLCADCPNNAWGSMITAAGKKAKACSDRKRIVVVPLGDPENEIYGGPMLLDLPPTSHGNLEAYAADIERRGGCLELVATRLSFDPEVAYPKIQFETMRWLTDEEATVVIGPQGTSGLQTHPSIERMLNEVGQPETTDANTTSPLDAPPPRAVQTAVQRRLAVVQSDPLDEEEDEPAPPGEEAPPVPPPPPTQEPERPAAAAPAKRQRNSSPAFMVAGAPQPQKPAPTVLKEAPSDMAAAIEAMLDITA